MKLKLAFFFLLATSAFASKWIINSFDDSEAGEPDNYIAAESGSSLRAVQPAQVVAQPGRLYVRQKFEDLFGDEDVYQIFQGRATPAAATLGRISIDGIPYATLVRMKMFYSRNASGDDDMETVYFDGKDVLVEGEAPIFINLNGRMEEFRPSVSREYKISITSTPPGATVSSGGAERGKTPVTFSAPSEKTVTVIVALEDHHTAVIPVTPDDRKTVQETVNLVKKEPLDNPVPAFRTELQNASAKKDVAALRTLKTNIQRTLNGYNAESKRAVDAIMAKFPANPARTGSESAEEFRARQTTWTNTRTRENNALVEQAKTIFDELRALSTEIDNTISSVEFNLRYEYIPNSALMFSTFGPQNFTVSANFENSRVAFGYTNGRIGYGNLSRNIISENQDDIHAVLKIWDTPNENGKYASFYDLAFFHNETPLRTLAKGTFASKDATTASRNTERDLNTRIARLPQKAAWDKQDEDAALDVLRAGDLSAPKPPVVATREEAYYDEDEDDDEFYYGVDEHDDYDYSRYGAAKSASDIFGSSDEYLFWTGMAFLATAIGTGVVGYLKHTKYAEAVDAIEHAQSERRRFETDIAIQCDNVQACIDNVKAYAESPPEAAGESRGLWNIDQNIETNERVRDNFNMSRIMWWSGAAVSLGISIVLFTW